jgi:hypothetical protein
VKIIDLFARIGVQADTDKLKQFGTAASVASSGMILAANAAVELSQKIIGVAVDIKQMADEAMDAAAAMKQLQAETGVAAETLQRWRGVAQQVNVSAETIDAAIRSISQNQQNIKFGEGDISGFQLLGIDPRQDPLAIIDELRQKTQGLDEAFRTNLIQRMGLGPDIVRLLELTNDEFERLADRSFIVPQSAIDGLDEARKTSGLLRQALTFLTTTIAAELAPDIAKLNKRITEFIRENKEGFIDGVRRAWDYVSGFVGAIGNMIEIIDRAVQATVGWKAVLIGIGAALLASPLGLFVAGIILLIAVLDDLYVYSQGKGQSLFGVMAERFPEFGQALENWIKTVKDSFGLLQDVFSVITQRVREIKELIVALMTGDMEVTNAILESWGRLGAFIQFVIEKIAQLKEIIQGGDWTPETGEVGNVSGFLKRQYEGVGGLKQLFTDPGGWLQDTASAFTGGRFGSSGWYERTVNNGDINVNVNTMSDEPEVIADAVVNGIEEASAQLGRSQ